jgi:outer membrane autotransporter protein
MNSRQRRVRRARLWTAIASAFLLPSATIAGDLGAGESHTVAAGDTAETWTLIQGARLTIGSGAAALATSASASTLTVTGGSIASSTGTPAVILMNGSLGEFTDATIQNDLGNGVDIGSGSGATNGSSSVRVTRGSIRGGSFGVGITGSSSGTFSDVDIEGTSATSSALGLYMGSATLEQGTSAKGGLNGILVRKDERGAAGLPSLRDLTIDGSRVEGVTGAGILVDTRRNSDTDARIWILNGSEIHGGNGIALDLTARTQVDVTVRDSHLFGDVRVADTGSLNLGLGGASTMNGAMNGDIAAAIGDTALWNVTGDSTISSLDVSGGSIAFAGTSDGTHRTLTVHGDLSGTGGGSFVFNTNLNEGGSLANQATDRVLVEGNVTTTGRTLLVVNPLGSGALTDVNQNGTVEANEGISLVQVAGTSRADAFALRGGYVAAGPWQYTLHAFGPGFADPSQSALASGTLNWDYRLGSRYVCQTDCDPVDPPVDPTKPVDPGDPGNPGDPGDPGNPVDPVVPPPDGRPAVVPQVPSYLSAPAALLTYGNMMNDGLRARLGDIRNDAAHGAIGGDVFARYLGGQLRYASNLSFQNYGYDFDQQVNALQVGGSLVAHDGDNGSLRAGWALDNGTTRVTPKAADGNSSAKYNANGVSAWMTWQHGSGLWVDGVLGSTRYHGDIGTDLRGAEVGRVRAQGWTMSIETGMPFALGNEWTVEPRFQLQHQQLTFRDFTDGDGLDVHLGTAKLTSATVGGRITRTANRVFMPYASLDLTHTSGGDPTATISNADWAIAQGFATGRLGNAYSLAAGAVSQLGKHVQIYGQGTYQHSVGGYGVRGWAGNVGVRVTF